jgi:hypothetical protein
VNAGVQGAATAAPGPSLEENEAIIERGLNTFVEVGRALMRIRDDKQYKKVEVSPPYRTFEDYCDRRWDMSRRRAYQLMEAAGTVESVQHVAQTAPASDRVARELKGTPEQKAEAWEATVEKHGPKPTAKQTAKVVQGVVAKDERQSKAASTPRYKLEEDAAVYTWVKRQRANGLTRDTIRAASAASDDHWPRPGAVLSKQALTNIYRRIKRDEPPSGADAQAGRARQKKTRMEEIADHLTDKSQVATELQAITRRATELSVLVYRLKLNELMDREDEWTKRLLNGTFEDLIDLDEIIDMRIGSFSGYVDDKAKWAKIKALRDKAASTTFPAEAETARDLADKLERKFFPNAKNAQRPLKEVSVR